MFGGIIAIYSYLDLYVDISVIVFLWSFSRYAYLSSFFFTILPMIQQEFHQELKHIKGLHRKLAAAQQKDPAVSLYNLFPLLSSICILAKTNLSSMFNIDILSN